MSLADSIARLAQQLGVGPLEPDAEGAWPLVFDGQLDLQLLPLEGSALLVRSRLAVCPEDPAARERQLRTVLHRNLASLRRQSEIVSMDASRRELWLYRIIRMRADKTEDSALLEVLEEFLNSLEWWRDLAADAAPPPAPQPWMFLSP